MVDWVNAEGVPVSPEVEKVQDELVRALMDNEVSNEEFQKKLDNCIKVMKEDGGR